VGGKTGGKSSKQPARLKADRGSEEPEGKEDSRDRLEESGDDWGLTAKGKKTVGK